MIVDIVFTYVDSKNKKWLNEKILYMQKYNKSYEKNRFNSNLNEISYAVRSIDKYFDNKYRNIYFVTNTGKLPPCIKPRSNFIPIHYKTLVGTCSFNSCTIESQLHKIAGLSEYYIYFNDDFILLDYLQISDFLTNDGKLIWYKESNKIFNFFNNNPILTNIFDIHDSGTNNSRHKTYKLLNLKNIPYPIAHCPRIFSKTLVNEFSNIFKREIKCQKKRVFRSENDFCFIDAFCHYYHNLNKIVYSNKYNTNIMIQFDYIIQSIIFNKLDNSKFLCIEDGRTEKNNVDEYVLYLLETLS